MNKAALTDFFKHEQTNWFFTSRNEDVKMLIEKYLKKKKKIRILDAGCGTGATIEILKQYGEVDGIDISQTAINFCKKRDLKNISRGNVYALPYFNNSYDLVIGLGILEHLRFPNFALAEFKRVLKKGGIFITTIPAYNCLWTTADDNYGHKRRYTIEEVRGLFTETGFKIKKLSYRAVLILFPFLLKILLFGNKRDVVVNTNPLFSALLLLNLKIESFFLQHIDYPFGVSIIGAVQK